MEVGAETARRLWERVRRRAGRGRPARRSTTASRRSSTSGWSRSRLCPVGEAHRLVLERRHRQRPPGCVAGALRRGRARERAHARRAPDARVLPAARPVGRASGSVPTRPSAWPATPLRTTAERWPTAPSRSDVRAAKSLRTRRNLEPSPATVARVTWAERAAERSPVVQRSRDRGVEQAKSIVAAARRLMESKGPSFTTQELIKEAGIALQTFYRYFPGKDYLLLGRHRGRHRRELRSVPRRRPGSSRTRSSGCATTSPPRSTHWRSRVAVPAS